MDSSQNLVEWAALARNVQAGDRKAAERLAEALGGPAFGFFRRAGLSHEDAEDLAQECVWQIVLHLNQFDGGNFTGWVYAIFRNRLADHFRRRRLSCLPLEERDLNRPMPEPSNDGSPNRAARAALEEALASLSPDERKVLEFRHGREAMPYTDLAEELGVSPGTARARCARSREKLETYLRGDKRIQSWLARRHPSARASSQPTFDHESSEQ